MAPVAVGICGTDKSFMFYSRGIYNSANCCVTQNHAVLLVGYGHDPVTDLDYWIAQNSWGLMWGERGFIRLLRTNDSISLGQCGLAMNPVAAVGGYVLSSQDLDDPIQHTDDTNNDNRDSAGNGIGKDRKDSEKRWPVHRLPFGGALIQWLNNNRQVLCLSVAGCLMSFSLVLLAFATYVEYRDNKIEKERNSGIQNSSNCSHEDNDSYDENSQGALFRNSIGRQSGLDSSNRRDCQGTSYHHLQRHEDCGLFSGFHGGRQNVFSNFISGARRLLGYPAAEPAPASFGIPVHYAVTELTTLASRTSDCSVQYRECSIQPSAGVISYPHKNNHIDYGAVGL